MALFFYLGEGYPIKDSPKEMVDKQHNKQSTSLIIAQNLKDRLEIRSGQLGKGLDQWQLVVPLQVF